MSYPEFKKSSSASITDKFNIDLTARIKGYRYQESYPKSIVAIDKFEREYPLENRMYSTTAINQLIKFNDKSLSLRIHVCDKPKAVLLYFHSGEFCLGRAAHFDEHLSKLSRESSIAVISCETRKAPINIFPTAHDDAVDITEWVIENAPRKFGCKDLLIGGESSGANLALHALVKTLNPDQPSAFKGYIAVNGLFECSQNREIFHKKNHIDLNGKRLEMFLNAYFPIYSTRLSPYASPLLHDLPTSRLPLASFITGSLSILAEENIFFYQKWLISQNKADLKIFPGGVHNFIHHALPIATEARKHLANQIDRMLGHSHVLKKVI